MSERSGVSVVASPAATEALAPLLDVWSSAGGCSVTEWSADAVAPDGLAELASRSRAVLVVAPRRRAPRTVLPGPVVGGVPVGFLPEVGADSLRRFAATAVRVHQRAGSATGPGPATLAVLGERHPKFDRLASRVVALADASGQAVHRWTAYDVGRGELPGRLATGPALGVYVGHGRPVGWVGYAGLRAHHLDGSVDGAEPLAALASLTCLTASRRRTGLSFAEALPLDGVAAATLGAVTRTRHTGNARWAVRLTLALSSARTVGELVAAVAPHDPLADCYRLIGDPTAPLLDARPARLLQEAS